MYYQLQPQMAHEEGDALTRSVRSRAPVNRSQAGAVVATRPVRGLQPWEYAPRRIAVIALDGAQWCFAWLVGGPARIGVRVRFLEYGNGDRYPTFVILARDHYRCALNTARPFQVREPR